MSRATLILTSPEVRMRASNWCMKAPAGTRVEFKGPKRTIPQSDKMWAMLTDVARQIPWHGKWMPPGAWKLVFLDGLKRELVIVPSLDGRGFVNIGQSSSDLSKAEMSDLIELIFAWGAQHGVVFADTGNHPEFPDGSERTAA